jgi:hypothetical protein
MEAEDIFEIRYQATASVDKLKVISMWCIEL